MQIGDLLMICIAVLVAIRVVVLARAAWRGRRFCDCLNPCSAFQSLKRWRTWMSATQPGEASVLDTYIANAIKCRSVARSRSLASKGTTVLCFLCVSSIVNQFTGRPRWMTATQDAAFLLALILGTLASAFPGTIQARTLDRCFSACMVNIILGMAGSRDQETLVNIGAVFLFGKVLLIWAHTDIPSAVIWNIVYSLGAILMYSRGVQIPDRGAPLSTISFATLELSMCVSTICVAVGWHHTLWLEVSHATQAKLFKGESSALNLVLNTVCDVVLLLDADLRITDHAPKLAALLMLGADQSSRGTKLTQFFAAEDDRSQFETAMRSTPEPTGPMAGVMHVEMRDAIGNVVKMELFHASFEGLDGTVQHLVGMREFTDAPLPPLRSEGSEGSAKPDNMRHLLSSGEKKSKKGQKASARASARASSRATGRLTAVLPAGGPAEAWQGGGPGNDDAAEGEVAPGGGGGGGSSERALVYQTQTTAENGSRGSGSRDGDGGLVVPGLRATSHEGMEASLFTCLLTWNIKASPRSCCQYHAAVRHLGGVQHRLLGRSCKPVFAPTTEDQCRECGLLCAKDNLEIDDRCTLCANQRLGDLVLPGASDRPPVSPCTQTDGCFRPDGHSGVCAIRELDV